MRGVPDMSWVVTEADATKLLDTLGYSGEKQDYRVRLYVERALEQKGLGPAAKVQRWLDQQKLRRAKPK